MHRRAFFRASLATAIAASVGPGRAFAAALPAPGPLEAVTGTGGRVTLAGSELADLRKALRGALLLPGQPGYEDARRVVNASIDKRPALVVQPSGAADVRTAVDFARAHSLLLAVKCGGHSYSGKSTCDGGMQIDLSRYRGARVDPVSRIAYVAGGSLLGDLDHEALAAGLVTTAGTVSHTGVGGLTLGGGFGRLARTHGLALDNLVGVDIVTADGLLRHASAGENPDLYWAVRGGGGNFGIVTGFEFRLHPMRRQVTGGDIVFPLSRARELLAFYAEYTLGAPDQLYCDVVMVAPPGGKGGVFVLSVCHSGSDADADRDLAPLRKLGKPIADRIARVDYEVLQRSGDVTDPRNRGEYLKSGFANAFPPQLAAAMADGFEADPARGTVALVQHAGGAVGRIAADATAFPHRRATHNLITSASWGIGSTDPAPHMAYVRRYWASLEKHTDGYYTNETSDEPQRVVDDNYQGNIDRLMKIKGRYDPDNLFRLNANIQPRA